MITTLHRVFTPATALLVGIGLALPAAASPFLPIAHQHLHSSAIVAGCTVSDKNACYLAMNTCLYRNSLRTYSPRDSEYRACEAAYFDCIHRFKCQRGPVW